MENENKETGQLIDFQLHENNEYDEQLEYEKILSQKLMAQVGPMMAELMKNIMGPTIATKLESYIGKSITVGVNGNEKTGTINEISHDFILFNDGLMIPISKITFFKLEKLKD